VTGKARMDDLVGELPFILSPGTILAVDSKVL